MIALICFIGIWLGLCLIRSPILFLSLGGIISLFVLKRFKYKVFLLFLSLFVIFALLRIAISYIPPSISNNFGIVTYSKTNYLIYWSNFQKYYVYIKDNPYQVGDVIVINGDISNYQFSYLESGFNFNTYLENKGVFYQLENISVSEIFIFPIRLNDIKNNFLSNFSSDNQAFIESLIFASSTYDDPFLSTMSSMHLYRLMSTSGLFVNAILNGFVWILALKIKKKYAKVIAFSFLSFYLVFTLFKFSILRLTYLFILRWINQYVLKNKYSYLSILSFSGISFLSANPYLAYQDSFILGYCISLFVYFVRNSFSFLSKNKLNILIVFSVFLFFIPFEASYYNEISIFSFLIVALLSPFVIIISVVLLLSFYKIPIYSAGDFLIDGFKNVVNFINPYMVNIHVSEMNIYLMLIYFAILILILYIFSLRFRPLYCSSLLFIGFLILYCVPFKTYVYDQVTFINVGQGDSTYIRYNNNNILIDTGGSLYQDVATESIIPFLKKNQIYSLDYVIITHYDYDHYGALSSLQENFKVNNVIDSYTSFPLNIDGLVINNLNNHIAEETDENNKSLVLSFTLDDASFLIMGDAPSKIENYIINEYPDLECDVLRVGHHGSSTSTSQAFIEFLKPKEAIISCGLNNSYGHPTDYVLSILKYYDVEIHRTDLQSSKSYYFR